MLKQLILLLALATSVVKTHAQIFGGTPSKISWKQINSNSFTIIFPDGADSVANRIASVIHFTNQATVKNLGSKIKKVPIVLRNENIISNGYVALAPFRSEFYLTPPATPSDLGSLPWPDMLAAHEYRHVEQYSNFDVGGSHVLKVIFGQAGQALGNAASIPDWFFEGDAVYTETTITPQGRGSLPGFYNGFRALWQAQKQYSWMKLRNGSYLDFVPDKYPLGFMLVTYGREKYGNDFWEKVTHHAASFKPLLYPFQSNIKKYSGEDINSFKANALAYFRKQFNDPIVDSAKKDFFANEASPAYNNKGQLIFLKSSVKQIPEFVAKEGGNLHTIRVADIMVDDYFQLQNNKIIYAAVAPDIRWGYRSYNNIRILDFNTGEQRTLTNKGRYFSPALDSSENYIIAVNEPVTGLPSLHLLDASSGKPAGEFTFKNAIQYYHPFFYKNQIISAVVLPEGKMTIVSIDRNTGAASALLPPAFHVISYPVIRKDTLFYSCTDKKNDELFAYTMSDKRIFKVISSAPGLGKYHVTFSEDSVAWSTQTAQGLRIQQTAYSSLQFQPLDDDQLPQHSDNIDITEINKLHNNLIYSFPDTTFESRRYARLHHPFNFHSLEPGANDPDYSLYLLGENILSTIQSQVSITYNRTDHSKTTGVDFTYGGLFPVFLAGFQYSFDRFFLHNNHPVYFNEPRVYTGFYIPLNLSKGKSYSGLTIGSNYNLTFITAQKNFKNVLKNFSYSYLGHYLSYFHQSQQALAQVLPRYGQSFFVNYSYGVSGVSANQINATARLYFPGFGVTHSLNVALAISAKDSLKQVSFSNSFPFARGYLGANLYRMYGLQTNYQLPLFYPEFGLANIVYWLRTRSNIFFDYTSVQNFNSQQQKVNHAFRSAGLEVFFDTRWWNQVPVSFGLRYTRLLDADIYGGSGFNRFEIILPVNLLKN